MHSTEINSNTRAGFQELVRGIQQLDHTNLVKLAGKVNQLVSEKEALSSPIREAELLKKIKSHIPASLKRRQKQLYAQLQAAQITVKEREELVLLNQMLEEKSAERIVLLGELAKLRGIPLQQLMAEMNLERSHA